MGDSVKSLFLSRIYENAVTTSMLLPKIWICCVKVAMHRKHKTDGPAIQSMGVWGTVWFWIKLYIGLMRSWDAAFQNFPEKLNHTFHGLKHSGIWYSVSHKGRVWQGEKRHLSKPKTFVRFTAILFLHQSLSIERRDWLFRKKLSNESLVVSRQWQCIILSDSGNISLYYSNC